MKPDDIIHYKIKNMIRRMKCMKYPYVTLPDDTEITFSDVREDGSGWVYIETPVDTGFINATCELPSYKWLNNHGYSNSTMKNGISFCTKMHI